MSQKVYDAAYEERLNGYFQECLPEKIYDAHFHLSRAYTERCGYNGTPFEQYSEFMKKYLGKDVVGGLVMAQPNSGLTEAQFDEENGYILEVAAENSLEAGLVVRPGCGRDKTWSNLEKYPQIKVLKPYFTMAPVENRFEADILDYAPEWLWEIAQERKMPVLIHLSHYQNMLSERSNIEQLRYISHKFPEAKIILAHCGMGHHVRKLKWGLEEIKDLSNIWFDCSGSTETMSIYYCLKYFGVERMMYGGDFDHGEKVGRICSFGSNFLGLHEGYLDENVLPTSYKYQPLNNLQEGLLALLEAVEVFGGSRTDLEKIFYTNAAALFS